MYKPLWKPTRVQGYLAVVLFSCLALFWVSCSKNNQMATNPSADRANLSLAKPGHGGTAGFDFALLGSASTFAVLGGTTVTNDGPSFLTGDLGVSPGTAITGFQPAPLNTIMGPGTVTAGLGIVTGTIYAGGPVAAQAHDNADTAYNVLVAQVPETTYSGVTQLNGLTFTPGVYRFAPSANLQVNGTLYLDFQGNSDALFIFQMGTTLVTMTGSKVIAINNGNQTCSGSNVYWAVGSSATIDGAQFVGTVIATTTITMTSGANVSGRMLALNGAVTMITDTISAPDCGRGQQNKCTRKVTGGGSIPVDGGRASFGFEVQQKKNGRVKGELEYVNHASGTKIKIREFTSLLVIGKTATFAGTGTINHLPGSFIVTVTDEGEPGRNDRFSISISGGSTEEGTLRSGNIQIHEKKCGEGGDDDDNHDGDGGHGDDDGHDGHHGK